MPTLSAWETLEVRALWTAGALHASVSRDAEYVNLQTVSQATTMCMMLGVKLPSGTTGPSTTQC